MAGDDTTIGFTTTTYDDADPAFTYTSTWETQYPTDPSVAEFYAHLYDATEHYSTLTGAEVQFTFQGTAVVCFISTHLNVASRSFAPM